MCEAQLRANNDGLVDSKTAGASNSLEETLMDEEQDLEFLEEPHEYRVRGVVWSSVTQTIGSVFGDPGHFIFLPAAKLELVRQRGKRLHACRHYFDEDDLNWNAPYGTEPAQLALWEEEKGYIISYARWKEASRFVPIASEKMVRSEELKTAGTMDIKGYLFDGLGIIDTKTTEPQPEAALQTAGYAIADGDVTVGRYALRLYKSGKMAKLTPYRDPWDIVVFKALVTLREHRVTMKSTIEDLLGVDLKALMEIRTAFVTVKNWREKNG